MKIIRPQPPVVAANIYDNMMWSIFKIWTFYEFIKNNRDTARLMKSHAQERFNKVFNKLAQVASRYSEGGRKIIFVVMSLLLVPVFAMVY